MAKMATFVKYINAHIVLPPPPCEGRSAGHCRRGGGVAPAVAACNRGTGRPRVTVRRHDDRPPSMAGRVRTKGGESRPDWDTVPCRAHGSYGPGDRKAAMERREAPASFKRGCGLDGKTRCATRCSVPSACRGGRRGTTAYPAPQRTRAMTLALLQL
jgi:hypothetical protein